MKVILLSDVKGTGRRGEVHDVAEGYYRNFLVPKDLAVPPNDPRAKQIVAQLQAKAVASASEIESVKKIAASLNGRQIEIKAKAQSGAQKLFGAIHEAEVASALGIEKKLIKMEPIKTLGDHTVKLSFGHSVEAQVTVRVLAA